MCARSWTPSSKTTPTAVSAVADGLFDVAPLVLPPKVKRDKRRTDRQLEALQHNAHPLSVALRTHIPLHADAAPAVDRTAPGLRCGTCVHRVTPFREVAGKYPKCSLGGEWARATGGPGTDVRAWWPACTDYEPAVKS